MLIVAVKEGESIEKALKKFKKTDAYKKIVKKYQQY